MKQLAFHTDNRLCIRSWEKDIESFTGRTASQTLGHKYYEVIPRIWIDEKDAVSEAVRKKKVVTCKAYPLNCLFGCVKADITIVPQSAGSRKVDSVQVFITPHSTCAAEKKLNQSQKLIDIGKIASTLAHGVRNPLNAIKGAVVYLREKYRTEETLTEFTSIMEDEITRLENFISNFLSSSVSETEERETDINVLLKKIEVFTSLQIYTRGIQSRYEYGAVPPITINTFHLEQAILNTINNAIEAMKSGGRLCIKTFTEERLNRPYVVIAISDTGPGLTDKTLVEQSYEKKENGRGFGFSITYEILKHYGGHLEIDSKKNEGTTISLFIPSRANA
jgi:two-component system nitrogen regulation sensor histidine kinase GlnL